MNIVSCFFIFTYFLFINVQASGGKNNPFKMLIAPRAIPCVQQKKMIQISDELSDLNPAIISRSVSPQNAVMENSDSNDHLEQQEESFFNSSKSQDLERQTLQNLSIQNQKTAEEIDQKQKSLEILEKVREEQKISLELDQKRNELQKRFLDLEKEVKELNQKRKEVYEASVKGLIKSSSSTSTSPEQHPVHHNSNRKKHNGLSKHKLEQKQKSDLNHLTKIIFKASQDTDYDSKKDHPQEVQTILRFLKGLCFIFQKASNEHSPASSENSHHSH